MSYRRDFDEVLGILDAYFRGLHNADVELLSSIYHEDAELKAPGVRRTKKEWLKLVSSRSVPAKEGHEFAYKVLSVEVLNDQAMAKVYCPLLGSEYIDYLGLLKEDGQWLIVNKMYADM